VNQKLHIDFEVFSEDDLTRSGVYRNAEHPSTEIISCSYAFDDGPVHLWIPYANVPQAIVDGVRAARPEAVILCKDTCPLDIANHISDGKEVRAHNAQYERVQTNGVAGKKLGIPKIAIESTVCTAAKMSANGLPRSLDMAAKALGTPLKAEGGRIEMLQLTKPRKPTKADPSTRWTFENAPEKWVAMFVYSIDDTEAERGIDNAVPDLIPSEQEIYRLDQRINQRGVAVDLAAVHNILAVVEDYKTWLASECERLTADYLGDGLKPTQREKISDWVRANGWPHLADMQAETVKALCKREEVPECVKQVLRIYSTYNAKAVSKLQAILDAVCADGRLRGMFLFLGAGTGRWSSLIVQLQNLMRPLIDDPDLALEAFATRSLDFVRMMYPDTDVMKVAGSCIRAVLIAATGKTLLFPDFVGVELRINAWLWNEETELAVYRAQDAGTGPDSYKLTYCEFFDEDINAIDWKSLEGKNKRQIGKVLCLAFGYEGGVSAGLTMVDTYGVDLDKLAAALLPIMPEDARQHAEWMWANHRKDGVTKEQSMALDGAKYMWRKARPNIKQGWKDLKTAAGLACEFPGKTFLAGKVAFRVCEYRGRSWLHMRLPSGRDLKYYSPRWIEPKNIKRPKKLDNGYGGFTWVEEEVIIPGEFRYFGVDSKTHQWVEMTSYGGQLDADADQGFASDLLRNGMRKLEAAGAPIIATVHDEVVAEVETMTIEEAEKCMLDQPGYTKGLPLAVETKRQNFYWK
jgi:DNA polymerase bacteriophage-type